jgi:glucose-fructose oxidoreductase
MAHSGELGEPRFFSSCFALQLQEGNIRSDRELGGGPLFDLGIYCINAARYLFREEPYEVFACSSSGKDRRFAEVEEMTSAVLRFSDGKLAQFTCSFGASPTGWYQLGCTKGSLRLDNAYEYVEASEMLVSLESGRIKRKSFGVRDQFAPELLHFSDCVLKDRRPEPDGREGLVDVKIIECLRESARTGRPVRTGLARRHRRPTLRQEMRKPKVARPRLVKAHSSSR